MPKIVCLTCETEYRIVKSGGYVIEYFGAPPRPYKVWSADGWECPGCGNRVMAGFGNGPIAEHFESSFDDSLERLKTGESAQEGWVIDDFEKLQVTNTGG